MRPLVTVVIPTRDRQAFLARAIDSALAQTYRPLEVIVVDDGSIDDTPRVVAEYVRRFPETVRLLNESGRGSPFPHNKGLRSARGQLVALLADDDEWLPRKLDLQIGALQRTGSQIVFSAYTRTGAVPDTLDALPAYAVKDGIIDPDFLLDSLLVRCAILDCTMVTAKSLFTRFGYLDESLPTCSDWDLFLRLAAARTPIAYVSEPLVRYRVHPSTISHRADLMNPAAHRMFSKLFALGLLPERYQRRSRFYLARSHLNAAVRSARAGDGVSVRRELANAARLRLASVRPGWLRLYLASFILRERVSGYSIRHPYE